MPKKREKHRHGWLAVEKVVDRSIPYLMLALALVIIGDFTIDIHKYEPWITYFDWFVIVIFVLDLGFKWAHVRKIVKFIKLYWLDLVAVFPFYLLFRFVGFLGGVIEITEESQRILHETGLLRESGLLAEGELISREGKAVSRTGRIIRILQRGLRMIALRWNLAHIHMHKRSRELRKI